MHTIRGIHKLEHESIQLTPIQWPQSWVLPATTQALCYSMFQLVVYHHRMESRHKTTNKTLNQIQKQRTRTSSPFGTAEKQNHYAHG